MTKIQRGGQVQCLFLSHPCQGSSSCPFFPCCLAAVRTSLEPWYHHRALASGHCPAVLSWSFYSMALTPDVFQLAWWPCHASENLDESPSVYTQRESQVCCSCLSSVPTHPPSSGCFSHWSHQEKKQQPSSNRVDFLTKFTLSFEIKILTSPCGFSPTSCLLTNFIIQATFPWKSFPFIQCWSKSSSSGYFGAVNTDICSCIDLKHIEQKVRRSQSGRTSDWAVWCLLTKPRSEELPFVKARQ